MRARFRQFAFAPSRRWLVSAALGAFGTTALAVRTNAQIARASGVSLLDFVPENERAALVAGKSRYDCAPALGRAMATAGAYVRIPAGRYPILSPIPFVPRIAGRFAPGPVVVGDGAGRTVLENWLTQGAMFRFDSGATAKEFYAIANVGLHGLTIEGMVPAGRAAAVWLRSCYMTEISDLHIINMRGDGIVIECRNGDNDASNMVSLARVRIENCTGWGIRAAAAPGSNEISFLHMKHVFVQNCGVRGGPGDPTSGGMRYKGQILSMDQCAFTLNQNVGLYIPGEAGLALNSSIVSTAFENNIGRHILCTGISVFSARNIQLYNNDSYRATVGCEFRGDNSTVREVDIDGVTVRATPGNTPYTAFRFTGANLETATCSVRNVVWDHFGFKGQAKTAGIELS